MNETAASDRAREAIIEQASAWFLRHRAGELSRADKEEFMGWLRTSKLNLHEYLEQVRLHRAFVHTVPELALDRKGLMARAQMTNVVFAPGVSARHFRSPRRWGLATAALLTLAVIGAGVWRISLHAQRIIVDQGEQRIVQLPDGSTVHINVSSQVEVKYSERERLVVLDKGQAFFEVAQDSRRPFRVRAGDAEMVALGTQFDVYRQKSGTLVTVTEGKVAVSSAPETDNRSVQAGLVLSAGQRIKVHGSKPVSSPEAVDARVATAWMRREVIFNGESLADVADEINRYIAIPVYIEDENLKKMRVRAVFNAYDSESFLAFLRQYGVTMDVRPNAIHVMPAKLPVAGN